MLVDLCCGNGLVTSVLAKHVRRALGIDFSSRLLDVAERCYNANNISYVSMNITKLDKTFFLEEPPVTKVCLHTAVQYFTSHDLREILMCCKGLGRGNIVKVALAYYIFCILPI